MIKLIFQNEELGTLIDAFRHVDVESFALILARPVKLAEGRWRLLVQSVHVPSENEYEMQSVVDVRPSGAFRLPLEKRAHVEGLSIIYCHSHPTQQGKPRFSITDNRSEKALAKYASERVIGVPHLSLLIGAKGIVARELGTKNTIEVWQVGRQVRRYCPSSGGVLGSEYDRQIRAFGKEGQRAIQTLRIGVVGCGGTGSIAVQQLAHLGVRDFLLIDPDRLDRTNLNRVVGAAQGDVGLPKTEIAKRAVKRIAQESRVVAIKGDVLRSPIGKLLLDADLIFCCTDTDGSRHFLNQLAYQYFIPVIDMGSSITPRDGKIASIDARAQMLAPGLSCLVCIDGNLSGRRVMWDLQNARQRNADPYFREVVGIKQPAVISLNGLAVSQAITMFLAAVAGVPMQARSIRFRGMRGDARVQDDTPRPGCVNCSDRAYLGKGDRFPLPERSR